MPQTPSPYPLLDELSCGILLTDCALHLLWTNAAAQELLQTTSQRITGISISRFITLPRSTEAVHPPDTETVATRQPPATDSIRDITEKLTERNSHTLHFDCLLHSTRGHTRACHATISRVQHAERFHPHHTGVSFRLELLPLDSQLASWEDARERRDSRRNRNWLLNLAHELKNPLGGILGAAQLMRDEIPVQLREYIDVIHAEAQRMTALLDNMLLPHRMQGEKTPCNIHEICEYVCTLITSQYPSIDIQRDYDISLPDIPLIRTQWIQILLNLMQNAAQELTENPIPQPPPRIRLCTRIAHRQTFNRQLHRQCLQITIHDNGRGIAPELLHTIFHPLVTGRDRGTGLGLALVQSLVHAHGGAVQCHSQPADGTRFTLLLPLSSSSAGSTRALTAPDGNTAEPPPY